jgi:hypothetical protein
LFIALAGLVSGLARATAAPSVERLSGAAAVLTPAESAWAAPELVAVDDQAVVMRADVRTNAIVAAASTGGAYALIRSASVGMHTVRRGATVIQQAPDGFDFPMSVTAMPTATVAQLFGRNIAGVLSSGFVMMGRTTADLRGAQVGDAIDLVAASGATVRFGVGLILPDDQIGAEVLISIEEANLLGMTADTRLLIWGFSDRAAIDRALTERGLMGRSDVRVQHSWDPANPDSTLGLARTKQLLGEFAYRVRSDGVEADVTLDWVTRYLPPNREILLPAIPVNARCNIVARTDLRAALDEVAQRGLAPYIDVANTNRAGGCYYPRFSRSSGRLGFLSRHSWGQAFDTNTLTNAQGAVPTMNCEIVRIFRKHNFAWGGNFLTPDGMHFEWVGEPRDQLAYPSRYCPNVVTAPPSESPSAAPAPGIGIGALLWADPS